MPDKWPLTPPWVGDTELHYSLSSCGMSLHQPQLVLVKLLKQRYCRCEKKTLGLEALGVGSTIRINCSAPMGHNYKYSGCRSNSCCMEIGGVPQTCILERNPQQFQVGLPMVLFFVRTFCFLATVSHFHTHLHGAYKFSVFHIHNNFKSCNNYSCQQESSAIN